MKKESEVLLKQSIVSNFVLYIAMAPAILASENTMTNRLPIIINPSFLVIERIDYGVSPMSNSSINNCREMCKCENWRVHQTGKNDKRYSPVL